MTIFCVTKLFKMVCDKVVRDKDVCERWCVTTFCVTKLCVTEMWLKDDVCARVCHFWVTKFFKMVCDKDVCDKVVKDGA